MSQVQGRSTPGKILRKREDKENDPAREAKRSKMRSRRVSFAPDDELETMHLYQKDNVLGRKASQHDDTTDDILADLGNAMPPYTFSGFNTGQPAATAAAAVMSMPAQSPAPAAAAYSEAPSPMGTPMSMDLTNNSFSMQANDDGAMSSQQGFASKPSGAHLDSAAGYGSLGLASAPEFTRNITSCVPGLSTLIEEDEDGAFDACGPGTTSAVSEPSMEDEFSPDSPMAGLVQASAADALAAPSPELPGPSAAAAGASAMPPLSPLSPFVLEEMRLSARTGAADDTEDLKHKWGFTPGAEDTLDVSHGHLVMGEATYNNVYGNGTIGDITRAMKASSSTAGGATLGVAPREVLALLGGHTAASTTLAPAPATEQPEEEDAPARHAGPQHEDDEDEELDVMGGPAGGQHGLGWGMGHGGAMGLPPRRMSLGRNTFQQPEMTLNLLAEEQQTAAWRMPVMPLANGHASVASSKVAAPEVRATDSTTHLLAGGASAFRPGAAAAGGAGGAGLGIHTTQLLGNTSDSLPLGAGSGKWQRQDWDQAGGHDGVADEPQPPPSTAARKAQAASFLSEQNLTLDDFQLPPELPGAAAASPAPQATLRQDQQQQMQEEEEEEQQQQQGGDGDGLLAAGAAGGGSGSFGMAWPGLGPSQGSYGVAASQQDLLAPGSLLKGRVSGVGALAAGPGSAFACHRMSGVGLMSTEPRTAPSPFPGGSSFLQYNAAAASPYIGGGAGAARSLAAASPYLGAGVARAWSGLGGGLGGQGGMTPGKVGQGRASLASAGQALVVQRPSLAPISFQDFLHMVDVQFLDDMRRRTSLIHGAFLELGQADVATGAMAAAAAQGAVPEGVHALELLYVTAPRHKMSVDMMDDMAARLEAAQSSVMQTEAALARSNPALFAAVQLSAGPALASLRDQVKALKSQCRERSHMLWTQLRMSYEGGLREQLHQGEQVIVAEMKELEIQLQVAAKLERSASELHAWAVQRAQQGKAQAQAALEQRQRRGMQLRQLQELQASNEQREARLQAAQQRQEQLRKGYEDGLQAKAAAQRELQELRCAGVLPETPAKSAAPPRSALVSQLLRRQEQVEVLMGLQGLALDARNCAAAASPGFTLTLRNQFRVSVTLGAGAGGAAGGGAGECRVKAEMLPAAQAGSPGWEAMAAYLGGLCGSAEGRQVPRSALRGVLQQLSAALGHGACVVAQLDALLLSLPRFVKAEALAPNAAATSVSSSAGAIEGVLVRLVFVHAEGGIRAAATLPASVLDLSRLLTQRPPVELSVEGAPSADLEAARAALRAAAGAVLPGPSCLQALCCALHDELERLGDSAGGDAAGLHGRRQPLLGGGAKTPLKVFGGLGAGPFGM